jgi:hypothetical protein
MTKKVIQVDAMWVDAANDSLKWLIILAVSYGYNEYIKAKTGNNEGGITGTDAMQQVMTTAAVTAVGLFVYYFVIQRLIVFLPSNGQSTYYWALKRK